MRLVVFGSPTAEADTVRVYLDRWTFGGMGGMLTFWREKMMRDFLHLECSYSHIPQVAVRFGTGLKSQESGDGFGCGSDGITRSKNKVAVKAERRGMTGSQLRTGCSWRVEAEGATFCDRYWMLQLTGKRRIMGE